MSKLSSSELIETFNISRAQLQRMKKEGLPSEKVVGKRGHVYDYEKVKEWIEKRPKGIKGLRIGDVFTNDELGRAFRCANSGGMRRSHSLNALVLISDHNKMFDDRWDGDVFLYTGMGAKGDQSLNYSQNKTLYEQAENGIRTYLFEVFKPNEYTYVGEVELVEEPFQEQQPDKENELRQVWIFPLKIIDRVYNFPEDVLIENEIKKEKAAKVLTNEELAKMANLARGGKRVTTVTSYNRNVAVKELAKRFAEGYCQLCDNPAPFKDKLANPYLEVHHIEWLSRDGEDSILNAIALCPSCHKKMHILDQEEDVKKLKERALELIKENQDTLI